MSKVYYRENRLLGEAYSGDKIKIEDLNSLFNICNGKISVTDTIDIRPRSFLQKLLFKPVHFKYAMIWFEIKLITDPGNYYIPKSIVFFNNMDYYFPSIYYFIAVLGSKIELRQCIAGEGVKWTEIAERHKPITDKRIINRVESSYIALKNQLTKDFLTKS